LTLPAPGGNGRPMETCLGHKAENLAICPAAPTESDDDGHRRGIDHTRPGRNATTRDNNRVLDGMTRHALHPQRAPNHHNQADA